MILALLLLALLLPATSEAATRYATTTAAGGLSTGDCLTTGTRCTIARALVVAVANDVVSLAAGTMAAPLVYQGANDMVKITGKSGISVQQPILVRCEVAGGCLIDGQFQREPLSLSSSSFWVFEDFNVRNGTNQPTNCVNGGDNTGGGVIRFASNSNDNEVRRVIAWDACISPNTVVLSLDNSHRNTFVDVAAFGTGRKTFQVYLANTNTCRRCWLRWEGSLGTPVTTATTNYRSQGLLLENTLLTWSGEMMPQTYNDSENGAARTNFEPVGAVAVLASQRTEQTTPTPKNVFVTMRGVVVYAAANDRMPTQGSDGHPFTLLHAMGSSAITITDLITYLHPSNAQFATVMGMITQRRKHNCKCTDPPGTSACTTQSSGPCEDPLVGNSIARGLSIRGTKSHGANVGDSFGANNLHPQPCPSPPTTGCFANETDWGHTNILASTSYDAATMSPWQNSATTRARLCFRTENGTVTTTPLWPWPMNERIKEATKQADKYTGPCPTCATGGVSWQTSPTVPNLTPRPSRLTKHPSGYDVTAAMEALFGTIPAFCKEGAPSFTPDPTFAPGVLAGFP